LVAATVYYSFLGVKALSILALGDSLTNGFHNDDKSHTPYAKTLEYLLNKDVHRCYTLTMVAKDGTEASEMSSQLQSHLQNGKLRPVFSGSSKVNYVCFDFALQRHFLNQINKIKVK